MFSSSAVGVWCGYILSKNGVFLIAITANMFKAGVNCSEDTTWCNGIYWLLMCSWKFSAEVRVLSKRRWIARSWWGGVAVPNGEPKSHGNLSNSSQGIALKTNGGERKSQTMTKFLRVYCLGTMDICWKSKCISSKSCWVSSVGTKLVDGPSHRLTLASLEDKMYNVHPTGNVLIFGAGYSCHLFCLLYRNEAKHKSSLVCCQLFFRPFFSRWIILIWISTS